LGGIQSAEARTDDYNPRLFSHVAAPCLTSIGFMQ